MPFIQGTAAGKVALSPFLNFRAEHYWVRPNFEFGTGFETTRGKKSLYFQDVLSSVINGDFRDASA